MGKGIGTFLRRYMEYYNISGVEFADSLGITTKHLSEIINKNIDISDELMLAISLITDTDIAYLIKLEDNKKMIRYLNEKFKEEENIKKYLKTFYFNELIKNKWITPTHKENTYSNAIDLLKFFRVRNFEVLEDKKNNVLYKKNNNADENKILLWIARCDSLAREEKPSEFKMTNIDDILVYLQKERMNDLNINNMIKYFNSKGLYLVICGALSGTKIRGCSKVKKDKPTIYLTTLYKDKASFYYALYHELGHIKKHYSKAKNKYILDGEKDLEKNADLFALDNMISSDIWSKIISSNDYYKDSLTFSRQYNIPMCFIVSRLAKEGYISYSSDFYNKYIEKIKKNLLNY